MREWGRCMVEEFERRVCVYIEWYRDGRLKAFRERCKMVYGSTYDHRPQKATRIRGLGVSEYCRSPQLDYVSISQFFIKQRIQFSEILDRLITDSSYFL